MQQKEKGIAVMNCGGCSSKKIGNKAINCGGCSSKHLGMQQ